MTELYLVRHGQTEWSANGRHTSVTDLDLTPHGEQEARDLAAKLHPSDFGLVLTSPRLRARRTAELAGFPDAELDDNLQEWFYGDYEGRTSADIRSEVENWRIWHGDLPGGETRAQIIERMTRVVRRIRSSGVDKAICFSHGHASRVLALCWLDIDIARGQSFPLETGALCVLGYEKESPAIVRWNA